MAGDLKAKEQAIVTLTSSGASMTSGSAAVANGTADFDARSGGNAPDDLQGQFELICQWATITGIVANQIIAELYLVPLLDGTNLPDIDLTAGASVLPAGTYVAPFTATKTPTAATNTRFISPNVLFNPLLMRPYILNRAGQTMSVNWTLKFVSVKGQYT